MKILVFGHVCIDRNQSEKSTYEHWGSPAMFMNQALKNISDCSVTIVSNYGIDFVKYLDSVQIYPKNPAQKTTLIYHNIISKGTKRIQKAENRISEPVLLDKELAHITKEADILVFAPILSNYNPEYIENIVKHSRKKSLKVLMPQGYFRQFDEENIVIFRKFHEADSILRYFDLITLSDEDYPNIESLSTDWAKKFEVNFVVTKGKNGAILINKQKNIKVPTVSVPEEDIVDSVGSGEIFSAALIHHFQENGDLEKAIQYANRSAGDALKSAHTKV